MIEAADIIARCNASRCGAMRCAQTDPGTVYAGLIPQILPDIVTKALTDRPGGPADPRQRYGTAYDNPEFVLHIVGEDLVAIDKAAQIIRREADRTAHITTEYGIINTLSIGPPRRTVRPDRPRYDVQMDVRAELIRPDTITEE